MAGTTGKNLYLKFGALVLSTDYRTLSASEEIGFVDQSAGADGGVTYLTTLKDGGASATIVMQSDNTATWAGLVVGTAGTLEWAPEGTTAGNVKHTVWAIVENREKSMEYADLVVGDVSWKFSDATGVVDGTY